MVAPPVQFDGEFRKLGAVPALGEHTEKIRSEFGEK